MRAFRLRRVVAGVASVLLLGGGAVAYSATVPNPDPCDTSYAAPMNSTEKLRKYFDCRIDRVERAIPEVTVPGPTVTVTVTAPAPPTTTTSTPPTTTATTTATTTGPPPVLNLPRIPWEGGAAYYAQFPDAAARGWADPNHFPVAIWWAVFSNDAEVQWDKAHGINTYVVTNSNDPAAYPLIERNGMSWIGGQLPGSNRDSPAWVGDFLDDEVDGRYTNAEGHAHLQGLTDALPDHDKIRYANYTSSIVNIWFNDAAAGKYVNGYTDTVGLDQYFYTVPFCSWAPFPTDYYNIPIPQATCRTASSYGKSVDMIRARDAADGKLQPIWNFVENVSGSPAEVTTPPLMTPAQVKGAAWSSLIHEARGLIWFNNVFGGPCGSGNAIRSAQLGAWACDPQIEAMGEVNNQVQRLAPVLNTQSYQWDAGASTDTMLKTHDGYAYVFAATNGVAGAKTINLPAGLSGSAEVVDEGRTVAITGGTINDSFPDESTVHIYKIAL